MLNAGLLGGVMACVLALSAYVVLERDALFLSAMLLGTGALMAIAYYLSRVRRWYRLPALAANAAFCLIGALLFFFTDGSRGSALVAFGMMIIAATIQSPGWTRALSLALSAGTPAALVILEHLRPEWVTAAWSGRDARFVFIGATYAGAMAGLAGMGLALMRAYRESNDKLTAERARAQRLLDNVLPPSVSERLQDRPGVLADGFEGVTVLFADLVGFTQRSSAMAPAEVVAMLNDVFSRFDALSERHGLEKVKTIGDAYMAVAGIPEPRADHAQAAARMALDMLDAAPPGLELRIGLHSGPAVAGVIGTRKFIYDLWGDTVNTASRMESHGEPGRVQISRATHDLLGDAFRRTRRGVIAVKGKGDMETFFLER
jgi:class 3 adenylate cyclase